MIRITCRSVMPGVLAVLFCAPAFAQKAKDTLRIGFADPIVTVDILIDPKPETALASNAVFDGLVTYAAATREIKPNLAESWRRVNDTTLEFKLRRDVRFHDGSEMTADDVVYSIRYLIDPASKLRFADNFSWVAGAQKIDAHTVRVISKQRVAFDLIRLATNAPVFPAQIHGKLADKASFGRQQPIGTGPYRVEFVDPVKGIMLVKNERFAHASEWRPAATIGRVHLVPMPDLQTRIAQLVTGGIELVHEVPKDQAEQLVKSAGMSFTAHQGVVYYYMSFDSVNRSGNAALSNPEVRRALMMAVDRAGLAKHIVTGGNAVELVSAICVKTQIGCGNSVAPPAFDLAGAKALLAKAGFPNGLDVEITSIPGAQAIAEAISGQLRAIGVRAKVDHRTFVGFRDKEREGKLQILVAHWSSGGLADVVSTANRFFAKTPRNYWRDEVIAKLADDAEDEMDPKKRNDLYRQMFDRVNAQHYILPLTTLPSAFVHTKDVRIEAGAVNPFGAEANRMRWN